ncbi:hypothetical protein B0H16DRAFT_1452673 [Mycena metata]|uniref:Uncharacterized protein n=1 Tax=Mycena metata TaxID=1033252 RepID=A0AAD7NNV5_9AGAR|nr:hypothetical protein B0H16DRAFT_1452673 [Mycena metata]
MSLSRTTLLMLLGAPPLSAASAGVFHLPPALTPAIGASSFDPHLIRSAAYGHLSFYIDTQHLRRPPKGAAGLGLTLPYVDEEPRVQLGFYFYALDLNKAPFGCRYLALLCVMLRHFARLILLQSSAK